MTLEAREPGIGSVWVCGFDTGEVAKAFALPESIRPIFLLPIGYPQPGQHSPYAGWHNSRPLVRMFMTQGLPSFSAR